MTYFFFNISHTAIDNAEQKTILDNTIPNKATNNKIEYVKKNILPALSIAFICYKGIKHRIPALTRIPETCDRFAVGSIASSYMLQILLPDIMREESPCDCNPKPTSLRREIIIFSNEDTPQIGRLIFDPETHVHNKANQNSIFKDAFKKSLELFKKKIAVALLVFFMTK
jgi:hypothetical protein